MSPFVHAIIAWLVAIGLLKDVNDRRLVVIAGLIADVDGVFILFDVGLYQDYHRTLGHSLLFGIPVALVLALLAKDRLRTLAGSVAAFLLHIAADVVGTGWEVYYLYPLTDDYLLFPHTLTDMELYFIINPVIFSLLLLLLLWIALKQERSPLEFVSVEWDKRMTAGIVYPLKYKCDVCGDRAMMLCEKCKKKVCAKHAAKEMEFSCRKCAGKG